MKMNKKKKRSLNKKLKIFDSSRPNLLTMIFCISERSLLTPLTHSHCKFVYYCNQEMTTTVTTVFKQIAEKKIVELEASRDLTKTWLHTDMDAFYAAVEILDNPSLKGKPLAVGGMSMICTASYEVSNVSNILAVMNLYFLLLLFALLY